MLKKILFVASSLLLCATLAHADEASKQAKVQELFRLTHIEQTFNQLMNQTLAQSEQMSKGLFEQKQLTDADQARLATLTNQVHTLVEQSLSWPQLEPQYITLYATTYSEEELDGILAFYRSPVGQAMLDKTPDLITKSSAIVQQRSAELQPKLRQLLEDYMNQISTEKK